MNLFTIFNIKKKSKVLIFGTGAGGSRLFHSIRNNKNVIGFLDNNIQRQGTPFLGKDVFSPSTISNLHFDEIIIASDYYLEIFQQLTTELSVPKEYISIFYNDKPEDKNIYLQFKEKATHYFKTLICNSPKSFVEFNFSVISFFSPSLKGNHLFNITWLDNLVVHKIAVLRKKENGFSYPPIKNKQKANKVPIIIPEVALFQFTNAQISTVSNTVLLKDRTAIIARVPSTPVNVADYSGGSVIFHSSNTAIVRLEECDNITKGIAIIGPSDTNYYHWLMEVLSKLQFLNELPPSIKSYPLLLSEKAKAIPSISEYLSYFSIKNDIVWLNSTKNYSVDNLITLSPPNYIAPNLINEQTCAAENCYIRKESIDYLRDKALTKYEPSGTLKNKRIFLARKSFIRDYNQDEVNNLLRSYGFTSVYLEDLSFKEQVGLMQEAEFIIGPTGAAWTNLIFANKKIIGLTWVAEEAKHFSGYSSLAKHLDIQLDFITYKANTKHTREIYYANYSIDCEKIQNWLTKNVPLIKIKINEEY